MKRLWFLALAVSVGLNAAMLYQHFTRPAPMQPRPRGGAFGPGPDAGPPGEPGDSPTSFEHMIERRLHRMTGELGLREDQVRALRAIGTAHIDRLDSLRRESRAARDSMRDLLSGAVIDSVRVREQARRLREVDTRIGVLITDNLIREAAVLDPGQRSHYLEMMRFDRRGRRGHGPR